MNETDPLYELQTREEERFNVLTHGAGLALSLVALGILLTLSSQRSLGAFLVCLVYGLTLVQLFAVSTFYHGCQSVELKAKARIADHCAIYLLIAGSYAPFMTLCLNDWKSWGILIAVWSLAVFGIRFKFKSEKPFGAVSVLLYLVMGWLVVLIWQPLAASLPINGLRWLVAGGVVYTLGVPFYASKSLNYGHCYWHLFVLGGAACHFVAVAGFVV
jgi:hemolysin III